MKLFFWFFSISLSSLCLFWSYIDFRDAEISHLDCTRIEPQQVNCQLTRKHFFGFVTREVVTLENVRDIRVQPYDTVENIVYQIFLVNSQQELFWLQQAYPPEFEPTSLGFQIKKFLSEGKESRREWFTDNRRHKLGRIGFMFVLGSISALLIPRPIGKKVKEVQNFKS